jgi:hypothetical protein
LTGAKKVSFSGTAAHSARKKAGTYFLKSFSCKTFLSAQPGLPDGLFSKQKSQFG